MMEPEVQRVASFEVRGRQSDGTISEPMALEYCTADSFGDATGFEEFVNLVCISDIDALDIQIG